MLLGWLDIIKNPLVLIAFTENFETFYLQIVQILIAIFWIVSKCWNYHKRLSKKYYLKQLLQLLHMCTIFRYIVRGVVLFLKWGPQPPSILGHFRFKNYGRSQTFFYLCVSQKWRAGPRPIIRLRPWYWLAQMCCF